MLDGAVDNRNDQITNKAGRPITEVAIIDDDRALLELTLLAVREAGFSVVGFHEPLDALMWASDAEPTCIIADLKMPGVEGLDLVAAFCALNRHAVIIVSAFVDVRTTVDAMRLGVDDVLPKPATIDELVRALRRGMTALAATPPREELTFTRRERQVAEMLVEGLTTKQIAQNLELSPRTVEFFPRQPAAQDPVPQLGRPGLGADPSRLPRELRLTRTKRQHRTNGQHLIWG